jgi:hypothetical protein
MQREPEQSHILKNFIIFCKEKLLLDGKKGDLPQ